MNNSEEKLICRRCKGTGQVSKGLDFIDDCIFGLEKLEHEEVEMLIAAIISKHGIKSTKRLFFRTVLWSLVERIRSAKNNCPSSIVKEDNNENS